MKAEVEAVIAWKKAHPEIVESVLDGLVNRKVPLVDKYKEQKTADYSGKDGCCLYCSDRKPHCWCDKCKCHSCIWYQCIEEGGSELGRCSFRDYLGFEILTVDFILKATYSAYVVSKRGMKYILPKAHARMNPNTSKKGQINFKVPVWLKEQFYEKLMEYDSEKIFKEETHKQTLPLKSPPPKEIPLGRRRRPNE